MILRVSLQTLMLIELEKIIEDERDLELLEALEELDEFLFG